MASASETSGSPNEFLAAVKSNFCTSETNPADITIAPMNISKTDAIAHLAKWREAGTEVRAIYKTITGNLFLVGRIEELSAAAIKITGTGCEMLLYFRSTSEYDYKDVREPVSEANKDRLNKYPTFIDVKFSNGDHLEISEFFKS